MTEPTTIDLRQLSPGADVCIGALEDLRWTVGTIVAYYLVRHLVPADVGDQLFALSRRFFALPETERRSIEMAKASRRS